LPAGYETPLGERGARLSTGQRQRIALARALLRTDAGLILLDEPGAGLDLRTESELAQSLPLDGRTALIAAHRPAFVDIADRVVSLDRILA
jgi:ABC-type multidrug transport system fused ATPase/permease subunit